MASGVDSSATAIVNRTNTTTNPATFAISARALPHRLPAFTHRGTTTTLGATMAAKSTDVRP